MDTLIAHLPEIITAAAQSHLGILALLSIALAVLAYFFFAKASEIARVVIFVMLFLGVAGFGAAMFRVTDAVTDPRATSVAAAPLSSEAKLLLTETAKDPSGLMLFERFGAGVALHAGSSQETLFTDKSDHRAVATWESALEELVQRGLMIPQGDSGEVFEITRQGYALADQLASAPDADFSMQ
jgi:hypothetical protein